MAYFIFLLLRPCKKWRGQKKSKNNVVPLIKGKILKLSTAMGSIEDSTRTIFFLC
jgi:hypothetical protein